MNENLERRVEAFRERLRKNQFSTPRNCKTMLRFHKFCEARGLSTARHVIYFDKMQLACRVIGDKDFEKWDRADIEKLFTSMSKKGYSHWSIEMEKAIIKAFFKWLYDTDDCPKFLKWLKRENRPNDLTREQLISPEDIERMIIATKNVMWKALLAAFTTGARPNEIHNIQLGDIHDEGEFIKIYVGRTGKMAKKIGQRAVYILKFADYFRPWLQNHPQKKKKDAWLFVNDKGGMMPYDYMRRIIDKLAKKVHIGQRIYPYIFRHSIGTYLYGKYGSVYARRLMGHAAGSRMEAVYCHLSQTDIEDVLRGQKPMMNGLNFGNIDEKRSTEAEFWNFINAKKMDILKAFKEWQEEKKTGK